MDMKVFEYFVALARTKSYSRAAHELYITPQGLSSAIKRLESSMGVSLVNPSNGGFELTEYGRIFHRYAQTFVLDQTSMMNEINDLARRKTGNIFVSITVGLMNSFPRNAIQDFNETSTTGAHVMVSRTVFDEACERSLLERRCDFALMNDPVDHKVFSSLPLFRDTMYVCVRPDSPLAQRTELKKCDLAGQTVSCLTPTEFKNVREELRPLEEGESCCTLLYGDEMIEVLELAMQNDCCAITLRPHIPIFAKEDFVAIPITDAFWGFSLAWRADRVLSPADQEFISAMEAHRVMYC
ncbi:hypothetical protein AAY81_09485 [Denitrobacterium detoxificans]|uniref:DNA-binding transcriptional regulator, LysR family n=1 Tax=Denitrobacterium detoxificans TaxID=79604 RepID=A0A172RZY2_9ACTN|nr:LysR family transcriptional regulator [Denitrobacterium detoxificans]ANE23288.1 hypothetical protein AAY81_09485 [Denitrobacterium detoxificans]SEO39110.1 DNA-binding transcriptional regulator, LysR family [Denitrobacterium detoxificans]